jgi:hypothetical protein
MIGFRWLAAAALMIVPAIAHAQTEGQTVSVPRAAVEDIVACGQLRGASARLACLDAAARTLADSVDASATWPAPRGQVSQTDRPAPAPAQRSAARNGAQQGTPEGQSQPADPSPTTPGEEGAAQTGEEAQLTAADHFGSMDLSPEERRERGLNPDLAPEELSARVISYDRAPRGELILELENGQIWRQKDTTYMRVRDVPFPVTIKRNFMGGHRLVLEDVGRVIRAERVS